MQCLGGLTDNEHLFRYCGCVVPCLGGPTEGEYRTGILVMLHNDWSGTVVIAVFGRPG